MLKRWKPVESIDALGGEGVIAGELSGDPAVPDGLLTVNGVPTTREIEVRDRKTRRVVAVRRSNADGTYRFPGLNPALQYDVIARDFAGDFEDVIAGAVRPHTPDLLVPVAAGDKMAAFADPYWADVVSLLHFDGADGSTTFTDSRGLVTWTATGAAQHNTAEKRFGAASLKLASINDGIYSPNTSFFGFGSGDFTLECFIKTGASGIETTLFDLRAGSATTVGSFFISSARRLAFWVGSLYGDSGSTVPSAWAHIAFSRNRGTLLAFIDGVQQWAAYAPSDFSTSRSCRIGDSGFGAADNVSGWIDEVRITKGVARYTANFTPPTAPFEL